MNFETVVALGNAIWDILMDMAPFLLMGFVLACFCSYFLTEERTRRHLGGTGFLPILKASMMGIPLPLCSCGVLPVSLALHRCGARKAAVTAFLAATPQAGAEVFPVTYALLGPFFAFGRFICAIISGLLCGWLEWKFDRDTDPTEEADDDDCTNLCGCHHHDETHPHHAHEEHHHEFVSRAQRWKDAARYAFIHLPGDIAILLFVGILLAAGIQVFLPADLIASHFSLAASYGIALLLGIPMYACSLAVVPIVAALLAAGISPGTAFILLITAPTTHIGALMIIWRRIGKRAAIFYTCGIIAVALTTAIVVDFPLRDLVPETCTSTEEVAHDHAEGAHDHAEGAHHEAHHTHEHGSRALNTTCVILLLAMMGAGLIRKTHHAAHAEE